MKLTRKKLRKLILETTSINPQEVDMIAEYLASAKSIETARQAFELAIGLEMGLEDSFKAIGNLGGTKIVVMTVTLPLFKSISKKVRIARSKFYPSIGMYKISYLI